MFIVRTARSSLATAAARTALVNFQDLRQAGHRPTLRDFCGRRVTLTELRRRIAFDERATRHRY